MKQPFFSIIIPGYNRPEPLRYTLRSAAAAARALESEGAEIILVDDGSNPPLSQQLSGFSTVPIFRIIVQANSGSIIARTTGLAAARGEFIQFLDSDDLLHPDKLVAHAAAHRKGADVVISEMGTAALAADHAVDSWQESDLQPPLPENPLSVWLDYQPAPHAPTYRRSWLEAALARESLPQLRAMDPSGDVWIYYNLLTADPPRFEYIRRGLAATGPHPELRYSQHWEHLCFASLLIAEHWLAAQTKLTTPHDEAVAAVGRRAFSSWRGLPTDFVPVIRQRLLAVWKQAGRPQPREGRKFRLIAALTGPLAAARLLHKLFPQPYSACRTLNDGALDKLISKLPPTCL